MPCRVNTSLTSVQTDGRYFSETSWGRKANGECVSVLSSTVIEDTGI